jgi:hypothetical protein
VHLVRPPPTGRVYVRDLDDDTEFTVPAAPAVVALGDLEGAAPRVASRGAVQEAFSLLFSLPFDRSIVSAFSASSPREGAAPATPPPADLALHATHPALPIRTIVEWSAVGAGAAALAAGAFFSASAVETSRNTTPGSSQATIAERDQTISAMNTRATIAYVGGAVAVGAGIGGLLFWPSAPRVQVVATLQGGYLGYGRSF